MNTITGVVLAGGQGTRLRPFTENVCKPLLPVKGQPMIIHAVKRLVAAGVLDIIVVIQEKYAVQFFSILKNGREFGARNISYVWHPEATIGMPKAIELVEYCFTPGFKQKLLVICADVWLEKVSLQPIVSALEKLESGAVIGASYIEDSAGFGLLGVEGKNVTKVYKKDKERHKEGYVELGVLGAHLDVFEKIACIPDSKYEIPMQNLYEKYVEEKKLTHVEVEGNWYDIGNNVKTYLSFKDSLPQVPSTKKILILGAGMAGLGAAITLKKMGYEPVILEKDSTAGGLFSTTEVAGCSFDFGPKILLLDDSPDAEEILSYLGKNYEKHPVAETIYLSDIGIVDFPLQRNLVDLPSEIREQILLDLTEAEGDLSKVTNFEEWLRAMYGSALAEKILIPYESKKWQTDLSKMDYQWALKRPVKVDREEVIAGSQKKLPTKNSYYYPVEGSIATLSKEMAKKAGKVILNSEVTKVDLQQKRVRANGISYSYDYLISTLPINTFTHLANGAVDYLQEQVGSLKQLSVAVYNFVFEGSYDIDGTAIYFPEEKFIFRRVSVLQNLCPALAQDGKTPISVEVSIADPSSFDVDQMKQKILDQLATIPQFAQMGDPIADDVLIIPFAYPLPTSGFAEKVADLRRAYSSHDVYHCGRGGTYNYCNGDVAYSQGKQLAHAISIMAGIPDEGIAKEGFNGAGKLGEVTDLYNIYRSLILEATIPSAYRN